MIIPAKYGRFPKYLDIKQWCNDHPFENRVSGSGNMGNTFKFKPFGSDIESGTGAILVGAGGIGSIEISAADTLGTIGTFYDRIAHSIVTASGNHRLGVYDDLAGAPNTLLAETGSNASITGYNWETVSEFSLTSTQLWFAETADNISETWNYKTGYSSGSVKFKAASYTNLPNPAGSGYTDDTYKHLMKIGHS